MVGIDRHTGKAIGREAHIVQSVEMLLTTPMGTRVMRREVGFDALQEDGRLKPGMQPDDVETSAHRALATWEPRINVDRVEVKMDVGALRSILVAYRDKETGTPGQAVVRYSVATG